MSSHRRVLCLWFPRLAVEQMARRSGEPSERPMAVLQDIGNSQVIYSLNPSAEREGLSQGQPLRDALALCPHLITKLVNTQTLETFLSYIQRWAGQFSPWISKDGLSGLILDVSGCAHLFGGEVDMVYRIEEDCARFGLTVCIGLADSLGAAWALSRYAGQSAKSVRSGDAIDQEAYATRSRAAKRRHWERGGAAPKPSAPRYPSGSDRTKKHDAPGD